MGACFPRHLGSATTLDPQQWTDATASGKPAVCCPACGQVAEIDGPSHVVSRQGKVTPRWKCDACSYQEWIELEAFGEEVLR